MGLINIIFDYDANRYHFTERFMDIISSYNLNITLSVNQSRNFGRNSGLSGSSLFLGGYDMRKIVYATTSMVFLMALCLALTFMPAAAQDEDAAGTITVTDDRGKSIEIPYPCERIVFLVENAMNTMYAVGGAENIVGIGPIWMEEEKAPFFLAIDPKFDEKVRISRESGMVNMEALALADPQLVVLWSSDWDDEVTVAIEENLGVPTFGVFVDDLNDTLAQAEVFGRIIGKEERAQEVQDDMSLYISKVTGVTATIPDEERPKVYYESFTNPYVTFNQFARVETTGGRNIIPSGGFERTMGVMNVDPEQIVSENPDVIIKMAPRNLHAGYHFDALDTGDLAAVRDEILERPELQNVNAVKNGKVYVISGFVMQSGPCSGCKYFLQDLYQAKWFHPELFEDIDPKAVHQEYLEQFQGLDLDLDQKGVFVYPVA